jgi:polysaccharide biosynthesis transport protein
MLNGNLDNKALPAPIPLPVNFAAPAPTGYAQANAAEPSSEDNAGFWQYWQLAKKGKFWLVGLGILGCLIGFVAVLTQAPHYRSGTTIVLDGLNENFMGMNALDPQAGQGNYGFSQTNVNTQIKVIESATMRFQVLDRLSRDTTPMVPQARTFVEKIRQRFSRTAPDPLHEMQNALGLATLSVRAKSITGTKIISITCDSTIPEIAKDYLNELTLEYITANTQQRFTTTQKTSQWLEGQLEETKAKLNLAENHLEAFVKETGVVYGGEGDVHNVLTSAKLQNLTSTLAGIQQDRIAKQTKYDAVQEMIKRGTPDQIPDIQENAGLKLLQLQLAEAKRKYDALLQKYTPANSKTFDAKAEVGDLESEVQKQRAAIVDAIREDYQQAKRKEEALNRAYQAEAASATGQQEKAAQYSLLKREVDIYKSSLNLMLQEVNQAQVVEAVPASNIHVLDPANASGEPASPDMTYYLGSGAVIGMAAGFGLVLLRDRSAKQKFTLKFGAPGYAPTVLSVPELGVIPSGSFDAGDGPRPTGKSRWKRIKSPAISVAAPDGGGGMLAVSKWQGRPSLLLESFRLTMTSLMLMFRNCPRVLVVTSPGPGEGKTTIAANLAMAMAEAGRRVLVMDLDLRRPQIHEVFELPNDRGFTDLIRGQDLPLRITEDHPAILRTSYPHVSVLPAGQISLGEIGEVFHSPRVAGLLRQLRECFDVIIVDTPPMLQFSESRMAGSLADGALLVLRSGHTDRDSALAARQQLAHDRIELLGTILNDWDPKQAGAASAKYGSYYSSYMRYHSAGKA